MTNYNYIKQNLNNFIKKYYSSLLIKGVLLFLSFGALFFIFFLGVEYFLWLGSIGRLVLLLLLFGIELVLFVNFILIPLFYLFKLKKGIDDKFASRIIGDHFPEVSDKLYNLLDLTENSDKSELLLASIEQRSENLGTFQFSKAIQLDKATGKAKWLIIPILLIAIIWLSGNLSSFFGSYNRVVNYDMAYEKPAPFKFVLLTKNLKVYKNQSYTISIGIEGLIKPDVIHIVLEGQEYVMQEKEGVYQYDIKSASRSVQFNFLANDYSSNSYELQVIETPSILDFTLQLDYPKHTKKKSETLKSVGNATILEGTKVTWNLNTLATDKLVFTSTDTLLNFIKKENRYSITKRIYNNLDYSISSSNKNIDNFEVLDYSFKVIKDAYPSIAVLQKADSLNLNELYFTGTISDDYVLQKLTIVVYDADNVNDKSTVLLSKPNVTVDKFYYTFPSGLNLVAGKKYSFYFEVTDNDGVNGGKSSKSQVFSSTQLDNNQLKNKDLENQQSIISNLDKSIDKLKSQNESLQKLSDEQKEKANLSFNDKNKLNSYLKKQELQEDQMQKFSNQLKENLAKSEKEDALNKLLQERLERQEKQAEKNKQIIDELKKIADKIDKEELSRKLEDLAKKQKSGQRNLEQLLELTKRYYVTEMASQLAKDLEELAKRQELLSKLNLFEKDTKKNQEQLNKAFDELALKLEELVKDNQNLKKPLKLDAKEKDSEEIQLDQKDALEEISKHKGIEESSESKDAEKADIKKANKKQKSASDKMKELSNKLEQSSSSSGADSVSEDAEVLGQILDNLVVFTFKQESLIDTLNENEGAFANQSSAIRKQQELRALFEHVDDSLFALSLRVPEISEEINKEVTDIYYNLDKTIENITDSRIYQGISYQKYVLTSGNTLSDLLANILDNMQDSMKPGNGSGDSQDFQLPDIIKGQNSLNEKMGKAGEGNESKLGKEGKEGSEGENGKTGKEGKSGKNGENGENGESGKGGQKGGSEPGSNGKNGDSGQQGTSGANGNTGLSEEGLKEIYEIYKQQEILKSKLEEQLQNMINSSDRGLGEKLVKQMSDFQDSLLENGITRSTIEKAAIIQYQLLKLEGAAMKQGKKEERESNANKQNYTNPLMDKPAIFNFYNNENEILNRQVLPLQQNYQGRIKDYFKDND